MSKFSSWFRRNRYAVIVCLILICQGIVWSPSVMKDFKGLERVSDYAWHVAFNLRNALLFILAGMIVVIVMKWIDKRNLE